MSGQTQFVGRPGDIETWPDPTLDGVVAAIRAGNIAGCYFEDSAPADAAAYKKTMLLIVEAVVEAAVRGRMVDLGWFPNSVIQTTSTAGATAYVAGGVDHPFRLPYLMFHRWEDGACAYIIRPDRKLRNGGAFEAAEMTCMMLRGHPTLMLSDVVIVLPQVNKNGSSYLADLSPAPIRDLAESNMEERRRAVSNIGDPVMAGLLALARKSS